MNLDYEKIVAEILSNYENAKTLDANMKGIAITGKMRSGKSLIAKYAVEKYGFVEYAFADLMKQLAHKYSGIPYTRNKNRQLYQEFGTRCRAIDADIWINALVGKINADKPKRFIITDVRFPNERMFAFDNEIPVIKIKSTLEVRIKRMEQQGDYFSLKSLMHETEKWTDLLTSDFTIENNTNIQASCKQFDNIITNQLSHLL